MLTARQTLEEGKEVALPRGKVILIDIFVLAIHFLRLEARVGHHASSIAEVCAEIFAVERHYSIVPIWLEKKKAALGPDG